MGRHGTRGRGAAERERAPTRDLPWRLAIVEDHVLQRLRVEEVCTDQPGVSVIWSGETLGELMDWLEGLDTGKWPHLVILDLLADHAQDANPDDVRHLTRRGVSVLVLDALRSPHLVRQMLRAGVSGVISKKDSEADLVSALWTVLGGHQWFSTILSDAISAAPGRPRLSDQEERLLVLYASGRTLRACAEDLRVRPETAKTYLARIKEKYLLVGRPVSTKIDLQTVAIEDGLLDPARRTN